MATESTKELKKRVNSKNKKTNSKNGSSSNKKKNYKKKGNYKGKNNSKNNYKKKSTNKKQVEKKVIQTVEPKEEVKELKEEKPLVEIKGIEKVEPVIEEFLPTKDLSMTVPTMYLNQVKEKIEEILGQNAGSSITIVEPKIRVDNIVIVNDDKKEEKETKEEVKEITQEELDELIKPHKEEEVYVDYELSKKIIIILLMALLVLSVGTIVLFMNLNVIDKSRDLVTMKTNLDVTYEIGEINDQKKVVITIYAKSNAGLKRVILPSGKVTYLDGKEQTIEYSVNKNGSYIFSISDKDNNVNQINVTVEKFS